ncbi:unnamed protein product [Rhodiola kirilowii]
MEYIPHLLILQPMNLSYPPTQTALKNTACIFPGVFTMSGIFDSLIYHSQRSLRKKLEIGKLG